MYGWMFGVEISQRAALSRGAAEMGKRGSQPLCQGLAGALFLGQVQNWVTWGQKLGHGPSQQKTLLTL